MRFPLRHLTRNTLARIGQSPFVRSVGVLLTGAGVAQLLSLLLLPVLTRIYSPEDFEMLAVFAAISIITYRGACLGFDYAIPLADKDEEALDLLAAALLGVVGTTLLVAGLTALVLSALPAAIATRYASFYLLLPLSTLMIGAMLSLEFWMMRFKRFRRLSQVRVAQVLLGGAVQVGLGLAGAGAEALLIGYLLLSSGGVVLLAANAWRHDRHLLRGLNIRSATATAKRFGRFPKFTAAEGVANASGVYLPVVIVAAFLPGAEAGFLLIALRLTQGPAVMLTLAVSQVFHAGAREANLASRLGEQASSVLRGLIGISVGPVLALSIVAPDFVAILLGAEYRPVGVYIRWIMPAIWLLLLSASIATSMHARERNRDLLALTLFGLALRVAAVGAAAFVAAAWLIPAYALSSALFYLLSLAVFMRVNGVRLADIVPRGDLLAGWNLSIIGAAGMAQFYLGGS